MNIYPIRTQADYQQTCQRVSALVDLDPVPDSPHGEELEILGTLLEAYESQHYPIDLPDPI
jgi:HTH-type transcriptional regulator / antitoxin HigA